MLNREIYEAALRLLAESTVEGENEDYEERAPFLIAAFCTEMTELNANLCKSNGESAAIVYDRVCLALEDDFPLSERLSGAACLYLAAMLIWDSDEERSDSLYAKYCDAVSRISDAIPAISESIINQYF